MEDETFVTRKEALRVVHDGITTCKSRTQYRRDGDMTGFSEPVVKGTW